MLLGWLGPAPPTPVPPGTGGSVDLTPGLQLFLFAKPRGEEHGYAVTQGNPPRVTNDCPQREEGAWRRWASPTCGTAGHRGDTAGLPRGHAGAGKSAQLRETAFPSEHAASLHRTSEIQMGSEIPLL